MQTSDGAECGLVKNIALTCIVSSDSAEDPVLQVLNDFGMQNLEEISPCTVARAEKVFLNDTWVGILQDGSEATVHTLKQLRRAQLLNEQVGLNQHQDSIFQYIVQHSCHDHLPEVRIDLLLHVEVLYRYTHIRTHSSG